MLVKTTSKGGCLRKTDIEIAQEAKMRPITEIAAQLGLSDEHVIPYGCCCSISSFRSESAAILSVCFVVNCAKSSEERAA